MNAHAIISHGLGSDPSSNKAQALAAVARELGWGVTLPDYREFDARGPLGDVAARIEHLAAIACALNGPLVLAGSSMGAYISGHVSMRCAVRGLFLMAPPTQLDATPQALQAALVPIRIVHGWNDELIPAVSVVGWAAVRKAELRLVDDDHRLTHHVDYCATAFREFLLQFIP